MQSRRLLKSRRCRRPLALVALALVVPAAAAAPVARPPIVIANYADDGSPGTLRHAIESAAQPGDTITFANAIRLVLRAPLIVPRHLSGLTIDGATPGGGRVTLFGARVGSASATIDILADSVTLTNVTLVNLPIAFREPVGTVEGPAGARVVDNEFVFEDTYPRTSALELSGTTGARVERNRFLPGNGGLSADRTTRTTIVRNTFEGGGLTDQDGRELTVEHNTASAGFSFLDTITATIARNEFGAKARIAVGDAADGGSVRFLDNTIEVGRRTGLVAVAAHRVEVRGNTVKGTAARSIGMSIECREQSPGLAIVADNRLEGLRRGLTITCSKDEGTFVVEDNTVRSNSDAGIVVRATDVALRSNTVEGNGIGILVERSASIVGDVVRGNRGAGILVRPNAEARILNLRAGGNGGPGIDLAPAGVTPNAARKTASDDVPFPEAKYDSSTGRLRGTACAGCLVQVYESEDGSKKGNPRNGEGWRAIGAARAGADGRWSHGVDCPKTGRVTMTATRGKVTSEFSLDVECGCLLRENFIVSGAGTPRTGFWSFGLRVSFPKGSKLERATLVDVGTEERPAANALGDMLEWEEVQRDVSPSPAGYVTREYLVTVSYRPNETGFALSRALWRFSIAYEPPRNTAACAARVADVRR